MNETVEELILALPKAELHLHLEGSVTPERFLALSRKYGSAYHEMSEDEVALDLFKYEDFGAFLNTFKVVCRHLREPADYLSLLSDLGEYLERQNVRYAEVIYTPSIPWKFGWDGEKILRAILAESAELERRYSIKTRWILDCVRQFGCEAAQRTAELAARFQSRGVVALGLGGDENSMPAREYEEVFAWARANELHLHVHAGEVGGPEQVWDALRILGANRIGHGIQAARDPDLMDYLKQHAIGLDVCLTSNLLTGAWVPLSAHPFWLLHKRGVPVTLNTDDPGLFKTSLSREYSKALQVFNLSLHDLGYVALQGIRSSFLPHDEKMQLMQQFQDEIHQLLEAAGEQRRGLL